MLRSSLHSPFVLLNAALALALGSAACGADDGRDGDLLGAGNVTKGDQHDEGGEGGGESLDEAPEGCHVEALVDRGMTVEWHPASLRSARSVSVDRFIVHEAEVGDSPGVDEFQVTIGALTGAAASAHYVVARDGRIACLVPTDEAAEHVANDAMEARSIGVELVGEAHVDDTTPEQMDALVAIFEVVSAVHRIEADREHVIGHIEVPKEEAAIAAEGNGVELGGCGGNSGHNDPGMGFDWFELIDRIGQTPSAQIVADQSMSWIVQSPGIIALSPGESRVLALEVTNTGEGTWEDEWFKLLAADSLTRSFKADSWQVVDAQTQLIKPTFDDGGVDECYGPLTSPTMTIEIEAPETNDCGEEEDPCRRTLTFSAYAKIRPRAWQNWPDDTLTLEVELTP